MFTAHHSKDELQQHGDAAHKHSSPVATQTYFVYSLLQGRNSLFAFRALASQSVLLHIYKQNSR